MVHLQLDLHQVPSQSSTKNHHQTPTKIITQLHQESPPSSTKDWQHGEFSPVSVCVQYFFQHQLEIKNKTFLSKKLSKTSSMMKYF